MRSAIAVLILAAVAASLASERRIALTQVVKIGAELRTRLERVAQAEGRDATSLACLVLREAVEHREAGLRSGAASR